MTNRTRKILVILIVLTGALVLAPPLLLIASFTIIPLATPLLSPVLPKPAGVPEMLALPTIRKS